MAKRPAPGAVPGPADGEAVVEAPAVEAEEPAAPAEGTLPYLILYGSQNDVKIKAQEFATMCYRDLRHALLVMIDLILALSGLPGAVTLEDVEAEPHHLVIRLPDWVRNQNLDPTIYALHPSIPKSRKSVGNLEKFISLGIAEQNGSTMLDTHTIDTFSAWLLVLPNASIRSVRHVSTIVALSVAEALGHHYQALSKTHETLSRQLQSARDNRSVTNRQEQQLKRDVVGSSNQAKEMNRARNQLLETIIPLRSRDVSEVIRVYTLGQLDRLMKVDPEMYMQNKWTARVFLMLHDPHVEVRLKVLSVMTQWYGPDKKKSPAVKEQLAKFAKSALPHLLERVADVDPRVAGAAVRCLKQTELTEILKEEEFDSVANMAIGSRDVNVREEAALFINTHVFQDPGICTREKSKKRGGENKEDGAGREGEDEFQVADPVRDLHNSETAISMLSEYIENYMAGKLRIIERLVGAFWPRSPALSHWSTMMNLMLVGEAARGGHGQQQEPITTSQRLNLLYILEAAVRRADDEVRTCRPSEKDMAATRMNEACMHIIPEMPRLMDICRPEEQQFLLLLHVCKMLVEYAVQSSQSQVLVNSKVLCQGLRKAIEDISPMETMKNSADSLLALAKCFEEAKNTFLDISREVHRTCSNILEDSRVKDRMEELRPVMSRFLVLANRGIDTSFGSLPLIQRMLRLLRDRVSVMKEKKRKAAEEVKDEPRTPAASTPRATPTPTPTPATPSRRDTDDDGNPRKRRRKAAETSQAPDVRLTLQLLEAVVVSVMWHVRTSYWVQSQGTSEEGLRAAESQVSELLQGFSELSSLRAELPRMMSDVRNCCCELVESDMSPYVQFHAYSAYMTLVQLCVGVSETLSLEVDEKGRPAAPTGWGATYEVKIPKQHMEVLYKYLNHLFVKVTEADVEGITFNSEGHRVESDSIYPAPSQNMMTSVRYLTLRTMQMQGTNVEASGLVPTLTPSDELLLAVLSSRMILESELQDIYTGPLGLLLLTQCEKARPKPLREVAMSLLRRLREHSKMSEEYGEHFYAMQQEAVEGLFRCAGSEAALSLSLAFTKLWGVKPSPWLERPLYVVLREAILSCVTPDRSRLELLDAYGPWIKNDFVRDTRCKEIADELVRQVTAIGADETSNHVARMLRKLQHL